MCATGHHGAGALELFFSSPPRHAAPEPLEKKGPCRAKGCSNRLSLARSSAMGTACEVANMMLFTVCALLLLGAVAAAVVCAYDTWVLPAIVVARARHGDNRQPPLVQVLADYYRSREDPQLARNQNKVAPLS